MSLRARQEDNFVHFFICLDLISLLLQERSEPHFAVGLGHAARGEEKEKTRIMYLKKKKNIF